MDKGYEKERFVSISIKDSVAQKFKKFCKQYSKSQSMTLLDMIDFFKVNEIAPNERLGETISSIKHLMKKRFNGVVAIMRDIEKTQTKPTNAMLQQLFQEASKEEEEEVYDFGTPTLITENEELEYYRNEYQKSQQKNVKLKQSFDYLLSKIVIEKRSFGKNYLKLNLSLEEYEKIKNH